MAFLQDWDKGHIRVVSVQRRASSGDWWVQPTPYLLYITLPQFYIQSHVLGPMGLTSELPKAGPQVSEEQKKLQ